MTLGQTDGVGNADGAYPGRGGGGQSSPRIPIVSKNRQSSLEAVSDLFERNAMAYPPIEVVGLLACQAGKLRDD